LLEQGAVLLPPTANFCVLKTSAKSGKPRGCALLGPEKFKFILWPSEESKLRGCSQSQAQACCVPVLKLVQKATPVELAVLSL